MSKEITNVSIYVLKIYPRNNEFFDDITGDSWKAFLESIESSGIIEPIVVTQNMVIVSGHQRVRAAKELELERTSYIELPMIIWNRIINLLFKMVAG